MTEAHVPTRGSQWVIGSILEIATDLLLRPERFFRNYLGAHSGTIPILAVWIMGVGFLLDRVESKALSSSGLFRSEGKAIVDIAELAWPSFWLQVAIGGVLFGFLEWWILGWWFRMRLSFSGSVAADPMEARLVFVHARLVWCVPFVATVLIQVPFHGNYKSVFESGTFALVWFIAPIWSAFVAYQGAVSGFAADPKKARVWFLILPIILIIGAFVFGGMVSM